MSLALLNPSLDPYDILDFLSHYEEHACQKYCSHSYLIKKEKNQNEKQRGLGYKEEEGEILWENKVEKCNWKVKITDSCDNVIETMRHVTILNGRNPYIPQTIITKAMQPNYGGLMFSFWSHYMCLPKLQSSSSSTATCKMVYEV